MSVTRRRFMAASTAASIAIAAPAVLGAEKNKRYRTATIGTGWWGMNITRVAIEAGASDLISVCDVDQKHLAGAAEEIDKLTGKKPKQYADYRELLEAEKPEIVIIGTPDHWHPLCMIAAVDAGAHVYVEKPISHTIHEGWAMVRAARAADRVVQVGTHRRASPHCMAAMKYLKEGKLGKIGMVRAFVHYPGGPGKTSPNEDPPPDLDWDMWCGPAPLRPFHPRIHPRGFRMFLDYANGTLGDWGIHWMDQILWWTEEKAPKRVSSTGGRHIKQDDTDAPDTQLVHFEFDSFSAAWEHRQFAANSAERHNIGCYFYGTNGTLHLGWRDGFTVYGNRKDQPPVVHEDPLLHKPDDQNIAELWADFLRCIETSERPICDIEIGHRATNMSLLGMLSLKIGRSVEWDAANEQIVGDAEANRLLRREYRAPWKYPS